MLMNSFSIEFSVAKYSNYVTKFEIWNKWHHCYKHKIIFPQKLRFFRELEHCARVLFVTPSSSHQQFPLLFTYFWKIPPQTCLVEANPSTLEISPIVIHSSHTPLHLLKVWVLWVFWHKQKQCCQLSEIFFFIFLGCFQFWKSYL